MALTKSCADFFAGVGFVQMALEASGWKHVLSVDYSEMKKKVYLANFPEHGERYLVKDVFEVRPNDFPESVFLAHASFPCTDVSLAGSMEGLAEGKESSAIDSFLSLIHEMSDRPPMLMLENVEGLVNKAHHKDLAELLRWLEMMGYVADILLIDAANFVPQSRRRVFIICHDTRWGIVRPSPPDMIRSLSPSAIRTRAICDFMSSNADRLPFHIHELPPVERKPGHLSGFLDPECDDWWPQERVDRLLGQMPERHLRWLLERKDEETYHFGTVFRRMRGSGENRKSTAELRVDGLAGCLRTPKGGSAKQIVVRAGKGQIRARYLSSREGARLMGAPDMVFPDELSENDKLFCLGDGVCVDVVRWLDDVLLSPMYALYAEAFASLGQGLKRSLTVEGNPSPDVEDGAMDENSVEAKPIDADNGLSKEAAEALSSAVEAWADKHKKKDIGLPPRGRLHAGLVVCDNLRSDVWKLSELKEATSTDVKKFFGARSLKNHTHHRVRKCLDILKRPDLMPSGEIKSEMGRTSGATKASSLDLIQAISSVVESYGVQDGLVHSVVRIVEAGLLDMLDAYHKLGGIEIEYRDSESIQAFVSRLLKAASGNSGAVLQHLVGAKLEIRYADDDTVSISHHRYAAADQQTGRRGDFEIGNTVFHITMSPDEGTIKKALQNAKAGMQAYLLAPSEKYLLMIELAKSVDPDCQKKVNLFSVEQFLVQNLDELAKFDKKGSLMKLCSLLEKYNELVDKHEGDACLKVIIPDFGF